MAVYFMQALGGGPVKIGHSEDVEKRRTQLETRYKQPLVIVHVIEGNRETEKAIHQQFARLRIGRTEQFRVGRDLRQFIGRPLTTKMSGRRMRVEKVDVVVRLSESIHERLAEVAKEEGLPLAAFIRSTLLRELKRREREVEK